MTKSEPTIEDLIKSLNDSIDDIHNHPTTVDRLPSNLEILVKGVSDSNAIEFLFSDKMDNIINGLFKNIESGNFEKILENKDQIQEILDSLFGKGSFQGPISTAIMQNIQASTSSYKYQTMRSNLGRAMITLKKIKLIMKNLERGKKQFDKKSEDYKKYKDAVYAIKQTLKFVSRVYSNRKIINKKVYNGLNNIVHEDFEIDEELQ